MSQLVPEETTNRFARTIAVNKSVIYQIKSKCNGNLYIGQAIAFKSRKAEHIRSLEKGDHHSIYLQRHFNKYGLDDLEFGILEFCQAGNLTEREQCYLDLLHPKFNMCLIAGSMRGYKHTEDFCKQVSDRFKGAKNPMKREDVRAKISKALTGRVFSEEHKRKISESRINKESGRYSKHNPRMKRTLFYNTCAFCGNKFTLFNNKRNRIYCSNYCAYKAKELRNGELVNCLFCGEEFIKRKGSQRKYCSYKCDKEYRKQKSTVVFNCHACGKELRRRPSEGRGMKYCNYECAKVDLAKQNAARAKSDYMRKLNSERMKGERNPNSSFSRSRKEAVGSI